MEAFTRFILKKSGYSGNISGTNIDTLTTGDYQNAAFLHKPLMRIAAERDRIRQLQKQWNPGIDRFEQKPKTKRSSNLDFKTGLMFQERRKLLTINLVLLFHIIRLGVL